MKLGDKVSLFSVLKKANVEGKIILILKDVVAVDTGDFIEYEHIDNLIKI